jgi:hypothetical protein
MQNLLDKILLWLSFCDGVWRVGMKESSNTGTLSLLFARRVHGVGVLSDYCRKLFSKK